METQSKSFLCFSSHGIKREKKKTKSFINKNKVSYRFIQLLLFQMLLLCVLSVPMFLLIYYIFYYTSTVSAYSPSCPKPDQSDWNKWKKRRLRVKKKINYNNSTMVSANWTIESTNVFIIANPTKRQKKS